MIAHFCTNHRFCFTKNLNRIRNILCYSQRNGEYSFQCISHMISVYDASQMIQNLRRNKKLKSTCAKNRKYIANEAFEIFNKIDSNHVSRYLLNAMMQLLTDCRMSEQALEMYERHSSVTDHISHVLAVKACVNCKKFQLAHNIIKLEIIKLNEVLYLPIQTSTILIDFYGIHCSDINSAQEIFNAIPVQNRNAITINAMMKILTFNGKSEQALQLYEEYQHLNNNTSHLLAIKVCMGNGNIKYGKNIIETKVNLKKEFINDLSIELLTTLIYFYGIYCSDLNSAQMIFNSISGKKKDAVTIGAMIKVLTFNNKSVLALQLYEKYELFHNNIIHGLAIKACVNNGNIKYAQNIIESKILLKNEYLSDLSIELLTILIDFYGVHCLDINTALKMFSAIPIQRRNGVSLGSLMKVLSFNGKNEQALQLYEEYEHLHNSISHMLGIKACISIGNMEYAKNIIRSKIQFNLEYIDDHRIELLTTLIDFYGVHCSDINTAEKIFSAISVEKRNTITIGSMMKAFIFNDKSEQALQLYEEYEQYNDSISNVLAIKACISSGNIEYAKNIIDTKVHSKDENSIELLNTLIDFYGVQCLDIKNAENIFNSIPIQKRDIITINEMMNAYRVNNMITECLALFHRIPDHSCVIANNISFVLALQACTQGTALNSGRNIHELMTNEILHDLQVQITLISMYGKCGQLHVCSEIFTDIKTNEFEKYSNEIELFHAMMNAYAKNGAISETIKLWNIMANETGLISNPMTFSILFTACSHAGNVEQARIIFDSIHTDIKFNEYVRSSFIDVLSRFGCLEEAMKSIFEYEKHLSLSKFQSYYPPMWMALLGGCRKSKNRDMSLIVYNHMKERFPETSDIMINASILTANTVASTVGEKDGEL